MMGYCPCLVRVGIGLAHFALPTMVGCQKPLSAQSVPHTSHFYQSLYFIHDARCTIHDPQLLLHITLRLERTAVYFNSQNGLDFKRGGVRLHVLYSCI